MTSLLVCEHCSAPRLDIAGFREQMARIKQAYADLDADEVYLKGLQTTGYSLMGTEYEGGTHGVPYLWPVLDKWTQLSSSMRQGLADARQEYIAFRRQHAQKRNETIKERTTHSRPGQYEMQGAAYAERAAIYDISVAGEQLMMDSAEHLVQCLEDLLRHIDKVYDHWKFRGVDSRWLLDRISGPSAPRRGL